MPSMSNVKVLFSYTIVVPHDFGCGIFCLAFMNCKRVLRCSLTRILMLINLSTAGGRGLLVAMSHHTPGESNKACKGHAAGLRDVSEEDEDDEEEGEEAQDEEECLGRLELSEEDVEDEDDEEECLRRLELLEEDDEESPGERLRLLDNEDDEDDELFVDEGKGDDEGGKALLNDEVNWIGLTMFLVGLNARAVGLLGVVGHTGVPGGLPGGVVEGPYDGLLGLNGGPTGPRDGLVGA